MANISDVTGQFQLINGDVLEKKELNQTLNMIKDELEDAEYATFIGKINENEFINNNYTTSFAGTGRWTYQNNIENMFEWIDNDTHKYDKLLQTLELNNIQFLFSFVEYEPGCMPDSLNNMTIIVQPSFNNNTNQVETKILERNKSKDIPITSSSLIKYNFISDDILTYDDIKNKTEKTLRYFDEDEIDEWLDENEDEFEDFDGTINVYVPENEIFIPK